MPLGPGYLLFAPAPTPPRYGLLNAATIIDEPSDRWMLGATALNYPCGLPKTYDGLDQAPEAKAAAVTFANKSYDAITLTYTVTCTARGLEMDEFVQRGLTSFQAKESAGLERAIWLGLLDETPDNLTTPFFSDTNAAVLNSGSATDIPNGLALLEKAIAANGTGGVIHMPVATAAAAGVYLDTEGTGGNAKLVTKLGNTVVAGVGYPGTGKAVLANTGTTEWAFATGPIEIRRSPILTTPTDPRQALDRSLNNYTVTIERVYLVTWNTCIQSAVLIDRCMTTC